MFRIHKNNLIKNVQLILHKEVLIKEAFSKQLMHRAWTYFRIPNELTQENLPMAFQYYNICMPILRQFEDICLLQYMQDCQNVLDVNAVTKENKRRQRKNSMIALSCLPKLENFFGNMEKKINQKTEDQIWQEEMDQKRLDLLMYNEKLNCQAQ